ncbi:MAG: hypothetical protein ACRCUT_08900 [Spirochaetota bacterium]
MKIEIQRGDPFTLDANYSNYLSTDGWALHYALRGAVGSHTLDADGKEDGTYTLTLDSAETAAIAAGEYQLTAYVTKNTTRQKVDSGTATVLADYAATDAYDKRSRAEITLEAVEATIQGRATSDHLSYTIAGRQMSKIPIPDLIALRKELQRTIRAEKTAADIAAGIGTGNVIRLRV